MKNTEIKYQLSTDYERLYRLLKEGNKIIGFYAYGSREPGTECSGFEMFEYNHKFQSFELNASVAESDFTKEEILAYMARWNVRYFDLPDVEEKPKDQKGVFGKYEIRRTDGTPINTSDEYFILKTKGESHPKQLKAAQMAMLTYAMHIRCINPQFADDLGNLFFSDLSQTEALPDVDTVSECEKAFNQGYACACATSIKQYGLSVQVEECFKANFMTEEEMILNRIDESDLQVLAPLSRMITEERERFKNELV